MTGRIAALYRYPVKGFTPERIKGARLETGGYFPWDRVYAVENGPSGFNAALPRFVSKGRFAVLARIPKLARARTAYNEVTGIFSVTAVGHTPFAGDLTKPFGRSAFAAWLTSFLDSSDLDGPLRVLSAPSHRFTDDIKGYVSVINLASVSDLEQKIGKPFGSVKVSGKRARGRVACVVGVDLSSRLED